MGRKLKHKETWGSEIVTGVRGHSGPSGSSLGTEWPSSHKGESEGQEAARKSRKQRIPRYQTQGQGTSRMSRGTVSDLREQQERSRTSLGFGKQP